MDDRGRRVLTAPTRLARFPNIRELGDGLLAVDAELYRNGRRIASYGKAGLTILGASRDGKVALLQQQDAKQLFVYHDGVANPVAAALSGDSGGGVVAPDGRRILIQRDRDPHD